MHEAPTAAAAVGSPVAVVRIAITLAEAEQNDQGAAKPHKRLFN